MVMIVMMVIMIIIAIMIMMYSMLEDVTPLPTISQPSELLHHARSPTRD